MAHFLQISLLRQPTKINVSNQLRLLDLSNTTRPPTLPTIVNELTNILENPFLNNGREDVVRGDQTMANMILRVSNTTFFRGAGERVRDVNQAIGTVGFDKVKDVVLNNSVFKLFGGNKEDDFSLAGLWKHSLGVGSIAREIAKSLGKPHMRLFTCGLVHDIGKVARLN